MTPNLLILGGTTEATALCRVLSERGLRGTISFAGRVERPVRQPLSQRVGGFGGVDGLAAYLQAEQITHLIDATHPFAAQMSHNAVAACAQVGVPLTALTRAPWRAQTGDIWTHVPDIAHAVSALDRPAERIMLAIGRMHLAAFGPNPQHFYLLRLVDPPKAPLAFPDHHILVDRGPFDAARDQHLMQEHKISLVISKNSGGTGARAKIDAARALQIPVVMIDRPAMPERHEVHSIDRLLHWLHHAPTDLGV